MGEYYGVVFPIVTNRTMRITISSGYGHQVVCNASLVSKDTHQIVPCYKESEYFVITLAMNETLLNQYLLITSTVLQGSPNINTNLTYETTIDGQVERRTVKFGHLENGKDDYSAIFQFK